jgi:hypothetical protein
MRVITKNTLVRSVYFAGLASWPLRAADVSADSGAGNFYALVLGLMATLFGGMALCYGLVKLAERIVHSFQAKHIVPASVPPIRHVA